LVRFGVAPLGELVVDRREHGFEVVSEARDLSRAAIRCAAV
jgi:hypothetical protein